MPHGREIRSIMGHGRAGDELESFLRPKRYAAGFPTTHTLHHPSKTMKEQEALARIPNQRSQCIWLPALLAALALVVSAAPARAQYDQFITPNQFIFTGWDGNLQYSSAGYYWTPNYSATPSATILIPLPAGLPPGWHQYDVYELIPGLHNGTPERSGQWHVVDIAADGTMNNNPTMPWPGAFRTDHQYLQDPQNNGGGWLKLGPGPQSDPSNDGGYGVWIDPTTGNGAPYLQIHYLGFEATPETFDAFRVVQIDVVPEPSALALGLVGGFALLAVISRCAKS